MTALSVTHCTISFTVIWRGVLVNCLVPFYCFSLFLTPCIQCVYSCIHTCGNAGGLHTPGYTHTTLLTILKIISFVTLCALSISAPWCTLLFFFSALVASSKPFFLSAEILSPPALCFNSEKQAPTHLSVFPYLPPHCVLQDLCTTQVTWVGGVEVCDGGAAGRGVVSQDSNTNDLHTIPPFQRALAANNKSLASRDSAVMCPPECSYIFHNTMMENN